jgi:hypothetical protein
VNATERRLGELIGRLQRDLTEELPPELLPKVMLYIAASELLVEEVQPADAGLLRNATCRLVLETLGLSDSSIERAKVQLSTQRDPDSLNWRN